MGLALNELGGPAFHQWQGKSIISNRDGHGDNDDGDNGDDDDGGYPAHSHHDKIPPWWGNVSNDKGGKIYFGIHFQFLSLPTIQNQCAFSWKEEL